MTCDEAAGLIDPVAEGSLAPDAALSSHLSTCASCARALDDARRLEALLRARPAPRAPAQFASRLAGRVQRTSWRREQIVDAIFNAAMIAAALLVAAGLWIAFRQALPTAMGHDAVQILSSGMLTAAQKAAPSLPLYAGATGLVIVALGLWWWASDAL